MISLGYAISRFINKTGDRKKTAILFDLAQDLAEGLQCKHQLKTDFMSLENFFVNAVILAAIYTPHFAHILALMHNRTLLFFYDQNGSYDLEIMYPYVAMAKTKTFIFLAF